MIERKDVWAAAELYRPYVGRWSRLVAIELLDWLDVPPQKYWLDVGCGPGTLSDVILQHSNPHAIRGIDSSSGFIEYARAHTSDPRACFEVGDAQWLPFATASVDVAVAGLVLNFVPQPLRAISEMTRVVRPMGVVCAYVWDYIGKMEMMRYFWDAAAALDDAAAALDEGQRFPLCQPAPLADLFAACALHQVEVRSIDVPMHFSDFDDYWSPFLGGQGPAPTYVISLSEARRAALRERIRTSLPSAKDGSIDLIGRAWAVRGIKGSYEL